MSDLLFSHNGFLTPAQNQSGFLVRYEDANKCSTCTCCRPSGLDNPTIKCLCQGACFQVESTNADSMFVSKTCFSGFRSIEISPGQFVEIPIYTTTPYASMSGNLYLECDNCISINAYVTNKCGTASCNTSCTPATCGIRETRTENFIQLEFFGGDDSCKGVVTSTSNYPGVSIGTTLTLPYGPSIPDEITFEVSNGCGAPARCSWKSRCCDKKTHLLVTLSGIPDSWWRRYHQVWSNPICRFYYDEISGLSAGNGTYALPIARVSNPFTNPALSCADNTGCNNSGGQTNGLCVPGMPCLVFIQEFDVGPGFMFGTFQNGATLINNSCEDCNSGLCYNGLTGQFTSCTNDVQEWYNYTGRIKVRFSCRDGIIYGIVFLDIGGGQGGGLNLFRIVGSTTDRNMYLEYPDWRNCNDSYNYLAFDTTENMPCYVTNDLSTMSVQLQYV